VAKPVANDDVHHRQRRIAGRLDLLMPVGGVRRARAHRIDDDEPSAAALGFPHYKKGAGRARKIASLVAMLARGETILPEGGRRKRP
jgi:hypothetical protein